MNLLLKTAFLFGLFCYVSGIRRCVYSCSCEECGNNGLIQECPNDDDYCYTAHHDSGIDNGCVTKELAPIVCQQLNETKCSYCDGDLCNFATIHLISPLLSVLMVGRFLL